MDIYQYITRDHEKVDGLMEQVLKSETAGQREALFLEIKEELIVHAESEERTFYKAIDDATNKEAVEEDLEHGEHEHEEIEKQLDKVSNTPIESDEWLEVFKELKHAVDHHVEEEESDIFKRAKQYLTAEQAEVLVTEMEKEKQAIAA